MCTQKNGITELLLCFWASSWKSSYITTGDGEELLYNILQSLSLVPMDEFLYEGIPAIAQRLATYA
jgi:hypothetical protein